MDSFYLSKTQKVLKAAPLTLQAANVVKPEDMPFEVDGPFFLLVGTFTALWTHLADCDIVKKKQKHMWSLSQVPGTGLLKSLDSLQ